MAHGPVMAITRVMKFVVLKDPRAGGLHEKTWDPTGLIREEFVRTKCLT